MEDVFKWLAAVGAWLVLLSMIPRGFLKKAANPRMKLLSEYGFNIGLIVMAAGWVGVLASRFF